MDNKHITTDVLKKMCADKHEAERTVKINGVAITVKHRLNIMEAMAFVDYVVSCCYDDNGEYMPELQYMALRTAMLKLYTGIDLPEDITERYDITTQCAGLCEELTEYIDREQYAELTAAVYDRIDILNSTKSSALMQKMNEASAAFEGIAEQLNGMFGNLSGDDIGMVLKAVANGGIDESKLMRAYLEEKNREGHKKA